MHCHFQFKTFYYINILIMCFCMNMWICCMTCHMCGVQKTTFESQFSRRCGTQGLNPISQKPLPSHQIWLLFLSSNLSQQYLAWLSLLYNVKIWNHCFSIFCVCAFVIVWTSTVPHRCRSYGQLPSVYSESYGLSVLITE